MVYRDAREEAIKAFEHDFVVALLTKCNGNVSLASRTADMDRVYLHRVMRRHGIKSESFKAEQPEQPNV